MQGRDMQPTADMPDHESTSLMAEEATPKPAPAGMKTDSITFRAAANGGLIANVSRSSARPEQSAQGPGSYESKDYAFSSVEEAAAFLASEFGGAAEPSTDAAPPPAPAAGGMRGGMMGGGMMGGR